MIPANPPAQASFEHTDNYGKRHFTHRPVLAWDDDGYPLVTAGDKPRRLVRADSFNNFHGVREADDDRVVGAIPGGGWMTRWTGDEGEAWVEPVVAWLVTASGGLTPMLADETGYTDDPRSSSNAPKFFHPDQRTETPATEGATP